MRHVEEVTDNNPEWPWRVAKGALNIGGTLYGRGAVVPDEMLNACANAATLVSGGYVRRLPEPVAKPARPAPVRPVEFNPPTDWIAVCRAELRKAAALYRLSLREAVDRIPSETFLAAQKQYGEQPARRLTGAAYGEAMLTPSGIGSSRRVIDGFIECLLAPEQEAA